MSEKRNHDSKEISDLFRCDKQISISSPSPRMSDEDTSKKAYITILSMSEFVIVVNPDQSRAETYQPRAMTEILKRHTERERKCIMEKYQQVLLKLVERGYDISHTHKTKLD